jgi:MFS family permease
LNNHVSGNSLNKDALSNLQIYLVVAGAFLALFAIGLVLAGFGVFFKPVSTQFGWTRAEVSMAASIASIISAFAAIPVGRLSDRFSPRVVNLVISATGGCAYILMSQMNTIWQLYLSYGILVGISMTNVIPIVALITRCFEKQRGWLMGMSFAGGSVGAIVAAPAITKLIDVFNWRTSYLITGIVVLILVVLATLILKDPSKKDISPQPKNSPSPGQNLAEQSISLSQALHSGVFWILVVLILCSTIAQQVITVHIIPHVTDVGITPLVAATIVSVIYAVNTLGNLAGGKIFDKLGSGLSIISGVSMLLISVLMLMVANQVWHFYVFAVLFGLAWGTIITLRFSMIAEIFGSKSLGSITGAFMLLCNIGGAASPVIIGHIFDVTGSYQTGFLIIGGVCLIGLFMAILLKSRKYGRLSPTAN